MRNRKRKKSYVAIKVDLEKAYDRLDWRFIENTLYSIGLNRDFVELIMSSITSVNMRVVWNGEETEAFQPSRGIRQGDPISPHIFVLCMERLGHIIQHLCNIKKWKPLRIAHGSPTISHLFFADDLFLFTEATIAQMDLVKATLEAFCKGAGLKVNVSKSKMFASTNVHFNRVRELSHILGIGSTLDLGKYLGIPIIHKRITKNTFTFVTQKVRKKLAGWKGNFLSIAGRTVLVKSVISAIPSYIMQTMLLPKSIIEEVERSSRMFLWNQHQGQKKPHLIAWNKVKNDKKEGGLGIKDLRSQNIAFIMKLCWCLVMKQETLWVKVLRAKYRCGVGEMPVVMKKKNASHTWQSICKVWESFVKGIGKRIGNGLHTKFWWDLWTPLEEPLINYVNDNVHHIDPQATVSEFILPSGQWNIEEWRKLFPIHVIKQMIVVAPPVRQSQDTLWWRPSTDGSFNVKSAYKLIFKQHNGSRRPMWKFLWKWPIPEKVKFLLWQANHERLLSNHLRAKWGLSSSAECSFNCESEEDTLHILRDCKRAREVWTLLINPCYLHIFFRGNLQDWMEWNARNQPGKAKFKIWLWCRVFGTICWLLWKNRCKGIFEDTMLDAQSVLHTCLYHLMEEVENSKFKHKVFPLSARVESHWTNPTQGDLRMDVDGSVDAQGHAACGGIVRDHIGGWITGFQCGLGFLPSTAAEVLAILTGLRVCQQKGFKKISLFTDSIEAINLIWRDSVENHPLRDELQEIRIQILINLEIELIYSRRENLKCADQLAKDAHNCGSVAIILDEAPGMISGFLSVDAMNMA